MTDDPNNISRAAGMHAGDKSRARKISVKNPNTKVQARLAKRLAHWEATEKGLKTHGRQKPGSQQKARCE